MLEIRLGFTVFRFGFGLRDLRMWGLGGYLECQVVGFVRTHT